MVILFKTQVITTYWELFITFLSYEYFTEEKKSTKNDRK